MTILHNHFRRTYNAVELSQYHHYVKQNRESTERYSKSEPEKMVDTSFRDNCD